MFSKKKKISAPEVLKSEVEIEKKPEPKKPAEGSRFGALWLLAITILLSGLFYLWGIVGNREWEFKLFETTNTWHYEK